MSWWGATRIGRTKTDPDSNAMIIATIYQLKDSERNPPIYLGDEFPASIVGEEERTTGELAGLMKDEGAEKPIAKPRSRASNKSAMIPLPPDGP